MKNVYCIVIHTDVDDESRRLRPFQERIERDMLHFDNQGRQCTKTGSLIEGAEYQLSEEEDRWTITHLPSTVYFTDIPESCDGWSVRGAWIDHDIGSTESISTSGKDHPIRLFAKRDTAFSMRSMEQLLELGAVIMDIINVKIGAFQQAHP